MLNNLYRYSLSDYLPSLYLSVQMFRLEFQMREGLKADYECLFNPAGVMLVTDHCATHVTQQQALLYFDEFQFHFEGSNTAVLVSEMLIKTLTWRCSRLKMKE